MSSNTTTLEKELDTTKHGLEEQQEAVESTRQARRPTATI
jgi:hypothetical protein